MILVLMIINKKLFMGKIFKKIAILSLAILMLIVIATPAYAYVNVSGYYRSNGTYVQPYVRSNPNGLKYDNYSYNGTGSLYNQSYGSSRYSSSWNTPSWNTDPSYYTGKSIYNSSLPYRSSTIGSNYGTLGSVNDIPSSSFSYGRTSMSPIDIILYGNY